jgi:hypothetical protein
VSVSLKTLHAMWRGLESDQIIGVNVRDEASHRAFGGRLLEIQADFLFVLACDDGVVYQVDADQVAHAEVI